MTIEPNSELNPLPEPNDPNRSIEATAIESQVASDQTSEESEATTAMRAAGVRIGSQRDPANKALAPMRPKAVRDAIANPVGQARNAASDGDMSIVSLDSLEAAWDAESADLDISQLNSLMESKGGSEITDEIPLETRITGTVTRIHKDDVFLTLRGQHQGVCSLRQFKEPPAIGAPIEVIVRNMNADGLYDVSAPGASVTVSDWDDIHEGGVVEARVTGSNTGGLECMVNNIRGFIPASQIEIFRVENLNDYIGKKLECVVTEAKQQRKNLVLSHRAIKERMNEETKKEFLANLKIGETYEGIVTKLMDFGAFVALGSGVEGLVHVSKLSWDRVTHPKEVFKEGEKVKVKLEKIQPETGKLSLSFRDTLVHPWQNIDSKYPPNSTVKGVVSRLAEFGAFVRLEPGVEGLIHVSELAHYRVRTVKCIVDVGQMVEVKILNIDAAAQKMSLSLKATQPEPEKKVEPEVVEADEPLRPMAVPKRSKPLRGGMGKGSAGEQFGLKW
jgi:small subunit ribosomal protein S1